MRVRFFLISASSSSSGVFGAAGFAASSGAGAKKGAESMRLELKRNPDILKELGARKDGRFLVGFAAETDDVIANAGKKLKEKNLDMIVANDVSVEGSGFEGDTNIATILDRSGNVQTLPMMTKDELADRIFDHLHALKSARL